MIIIYKISNPDGEVYIGQTKNLRPHEKELRRERLSVGVYQAFKQNIFLGEFRFSYEVAEKLELATRTVHRLSVDGKEGAKGKNKGITVLFKRKSN